MKNVLNTVKSENGEESGLIVSESEINDSFANVISSIGYSAVENELILKKFTFDKKIHTIVSLQKDSERRSNIVFYTNLLMKNESVMCIGFLKHSIFSQSKKGKEINKELYKYFLENKGDLMILKRLDSECSDFLNYLLEFVINIIENYGFKEVLLKKIYEIRKHLDSKIFYKFINTITETKAFFDDYNIRNPRHCECLCGSMLRNIIVEIFSLPVINDELNFLKKVLEEKKGSVNMNCLIRPDEIKIIKSKFSSKNNYDDFLGLVVECVSNNRHDFNENFYDNEFYNEKFRDEKFYDEKFCSDKFNYKIISNDKLQCPRKIYTEDDNDNLESKILKETQNLSDLKYLSISKEKTELVKTICDLQNEIKELKLKLNCDNSINKNIINNNNKNIDSSICNNANKDENNIKPSDNTDKVNSKISNNNKAQDIISDSDKSQNKILNSNKSQDAISKNSKIKSGKSKFGKNRLSKESKFKGKNYIGLKWKKCNAFPGSIFEKIDSLEFEKNFREDEFKDFIVTGKETKHEIKDETNKMSRNVVVTSLEPKKSHALNIAMGRIKTENSEIINSIMNKTFKNDNLINQILMYFPTPEEFNTIKSSKKVLGRAEEFFREIEDVKGFYASAYQIKFCNQLYKQDYSAIIFCLKKTYQRIFESSELVKLFSALLVIGNVLNSNKFLGKARGFEIQSISEFKTDNIIRILINKIDIDKLISDLEFEKEVSNVNLETIREEITELKKMFNEEFFEAKISKDFNNILREYNEMMEIYQKLKKYFMAEDDMFIKTIRDYVDLLKSESKKLNKR